MADDTTTEAPPTGAVARPKRIPATLFDMVRSLGVMVVVIALTLIFVPGLLHPSKSQRFAAVGYSDYTEGFKQVTGIDALVPTGLAAGWYANSGALTHSGTDANLRIGWVTPAKNYLALDESNNSAKDFISDVLGSDGLKVTGYEQIAGATWTECASDQREKSIVRTFDDGVTVVITGSGTKTEQSDLATALRNA
ncbi:MAG TPA: DUF4245 domain-containing protein [Mycobacteriales bacterium]|jgi:hypothetical protein|nr:DUF4245 domain-containing protein [Mycobacteriales bacterium]